MDEIAKDLKNLIPVGDTKKPGCLLWMDDVVLLHTDKNQMQQMLNTTLQLLFFQYFILKSCKSLSKHHSGHLNSGTL